MPEVRDFDLAIPLLDSALKIKFGATLPEKETQKRDHSTQPVL